MKDESAAELERLARLGRRRPWPPRAASGADFASNDYLGFTRRPELIAAAHTALERFGVGSGAARQLGGAAEALLEAERAAADWLGAEAALLFPSGYQANLGVLCALCRAGDVLVSDALNHASIVDAARLAHSQTIVVPHLDLAALERALVGARGARRRIVAIESVFSMDGDLAPLQAIVDLCERHDAWLVLDEAHAIGLLGPRGAGAWPAAVADGAPHDRLAVRIVTGSKSLGVAGAFAVGPRATIEWIANAARSFLFTTAPPPMVGSALVRAIELAADAEVERAAVLDHARRLAHALDLPTPAAAIVPFVIGGDEQAVVVAQRLVAAGFDARAVRPPTVPEGTARLRLVTHAHNTREEVDALAKALLGEKRGSAPAIHTRAARELLVVAGTDTDVGKTVVSAALLLAAPEHWRYWKPVQTGADSDTERVLALTELQQTRCAAPLASYPLPASPHEAAAAAGARVPVGGLDGALARELADGGVLLELAGGLLVPYDETTTQIDWLARLQPRLVLVARAGLGTLNHTLLSVEALARRRITPALVVLVGERHPSNHATLSARLAPVPVVEFPRLDRVDRAALEAWIESSGVRTLFFEEKVRR